MLELLKGIRGKRARIVVDHILEHGYITTEQLEKDYGYNHPPRAIRDVREQGVPIEVFKVKNAQGRTIAAYRFGTIDKTLIARRGRSAFPKSFKEQLAQKHQNICEICRGTFDQRYLQIDHRVPYEVAGDGELTEANYMLICAACNRAKSWVCEHCPNWLQQHHVELCRTCYWASPEQYSHIAMQNIRRTELIWTDDEIADYERLKELAEQSGLDISEYIKRLLQA